MKRWLMLAALCGTAFGAQAIDPSSIPGLADTAEKIRSGEINVGKTYTMKFDGRFHTVHAEALGIGCVSCHTAPSYAADHLFLRKAEYPRRGSPGAVGRATCIGCHQQEGVATPFYGTAGR
ncbi:MAG: hypothetical protein HY778_00825 [Betaproteobacteria bacterium]|nr:hypothetical protein [Betaproteobacteria bacterium]